MFFSVRLIMSRLFFLVALIVVSSNVAQSVPCRLSYFSPRFRNGAYVTADGSQNTRIDNIVAVSPRFWKAYKGKNVFIDGKTYEVKDTFPDGEKSDFTVFARTKKMDGVGECSWTPTRRPSPAPISSPFPYPPSPFPPSPFPPSPSPPSPFPPSPSPFPHTRKHVEKSPARTKTNCMVTYYSDSASENDGYTTTADGSSLDANDKIVAVASSHYKQLKHKKIRFNGVVYTVRDQCSGCSNDYFHIDILVHSSSEAFKRGVDHGVCEFV